MKVSRSSWVYRWAYFFQSSENRPSTTSLCRVFWRLVFVGLVLVPLWVVVGLPLGFVLGFPFAARPRIPAWDGWNWGIIDLEDFLNAFWVPYTWWWPRIDKGRTRVWPIVPAVLFLVIYGFGFTSPGRWGLVVMVSIGAVIGLVHLLRYLRRRWRNRTGEAVASTNPTVWEVSTAYVRARKSRICPIIEFVE